MNENQEFDPCMKEEQEARKATEEMIWAAMRRQLPIATNEKGITIYISFELAESLMRNDEEFKQKYEIYLAKARALGDCRARNKPA